MTRSGKLGTTLKSRLHHNFLSRGVVTCSRMKAENLAFLDSVTRQFSSLPIRLESILNGFHMHGWKLFRCVKAGFHMIAESSAIVCDHMEPHFCDRLRSCNRDRRRSQKIEPDRRRCSIFCDRLQSSAIVCNPAIEMYPIIFLILTDDSTFLSHKAQMFDYSNAHLL